MEFRAVTVISRAESSNSPIDTTSSMFLLNCPGLRDPGYGSKRTSQVDGLKKTHRIHGAAIYGDIM